MVYLQIFHPNLTSRVLDPLAYFLPFPTSILPETPSSGHLLVELVPCSLLFFPVVYFKGLSRAYRVQMANRYVIMFCFIFICFIILLFFDLIVIQSYLVIFSYMLFIIYFYMFSHCVDNFRNSINIRGDHNVLRYLIE